MRPSDTTQTKLSDKEWRDLILTDLKAKEEVGITPLFAHLPDCLQGRHVFWPRVSGLKGCFSHQECSLRPFD